MFVDGKYVTFVYHRKDANGYWHVSFENYKGQIVFGYLDANNKFICYEVV